MEYEKIISEWKKDFILRIKNLSGSKKTNFEYQDAVDKSSTHRTRYDEVLIEYLDFIDKRPLKNNDYFKYVNAYRAGKKLNLKYFRHCKEKLEEYYSKIDKNESYNTFNFDLYRRYVFYMMLRLNGFYKIEYDILFNVKIKDNREYSPLSSIPSVLRAELPFKIKEVDIYRAFPTFIDKELGIKKREQDVYELVDKKKFNSLINSHKDVKGVSIKSLRDQLSPIYGDRAKEVLTDERFSSKGKMFKNLVKYEQKAINKLVRKNTLNNFARLHDGIFVKENVVIQKLEFNNYKFVVKKSERVKIQDVPRPFYSFNKEGKLITSASQYAEFFEQENFIRGRELNNDKLIIFKDTNNVVSPFNNKSETVAFLKNEINEICSTEIENRIAKEHNTIIQQGFHLLVSKLIDYHTDKINTFGLPFKNSFINYTFSTNNQSVKLQLEKLNYKEFSTFFAPHKIQEHIFSETEELSEFQIFLTMASTGKDPRKTELNKSDEDTINKFCRMYGYLCHTYKNPAFNPCIILSDEGANDVNRNGGRGKTIFANALQHIQPSLLKGGKEFNSNYIHNFADLKIDKRLYIIDDVPAGFNYDDLYTNIVGGISPQRKGTEAVEIPFEKAPKFVITTNWAVRYDENEASTNRRFIEFKFTDFFNQNNTPFDQFGHTLFADWDKEEWNRFYNFTFSCVALYLTEGLERIDYNKSEDNFRAIFNNDSVLEEFERIFELIKVNDGGFNVKDFLSHYNYFDNPLKYEKHFHTRNVRKYIDIYIKYNNLNIEYVKSGRRWKNND
ncbi:MAG: hypothetical protein ACSHW7_14285 [Patiriisocius sp.]|uniref:hypothetical protein n=1 Tax=Patiriisocius sp. TaxID=2822396 RepID=UPI003EFAEF58